jgi:DNA-binding response OmpR family regulator
MARPMEMTRPATSHFGPTFGKPDRCPICPFTVADMMSVQGVDVDLATRRVWRDGVEIRMSNKEFDLVSYLIARAGDVVTREELMREVWHTTFWTSAKTIDVHLGWVRRKLGDDTRRPTLITTIRGRGLRFEVSPPMYAEHTAKSAS